MPHVAIRIRPHSRRRHHDGDSLGGSLRGPRHRRGAFLAQQLAVQPRNHQPDVGDGVLAQLHSARQEEPTQEAR